MASDEVCRRAAVKKLCGKADGTSELPVQHWRLHQKRRGVAGEIDRRCFIPATNVVSRKRLGEHHRRMMKEKKICLLGEDAEQSLFLNEKEKFYMKRDSVPAILKWNVI